MPIILIVLALLLGAAASAGDELPADLARFEDRIVEVIRAVSPAVVTVTVWRLTGEGEEGGDGQEVESGGSGVIIDPRGYVLTCEHVVADARDVRVGLPDGRRFSAQRLGFDEAGDVALLKIPGDDLPSVDLGDSDTLRVGQWVIALGNPFGLSTDDVPAASLGLVSGLNRYQGGSKIYGAAIQTDAAINPGNSGGPLVDLRGKLVGLNGRITTRGEDRLNVGVGFAIPVNQIRLILDALKRGDNVERGYLGVLFDSQETGRGCLVREVIGNSPAARAGLRPGDVIVEINGEPIDHPTRLQNKISFFPANTEVRVTLQRGGENLSLDVKLGPRPREFR